MQNQHQQDTIAAIATPPGKGGVGIIRVSGSQAKSIAEKICSKSIKVKTPVLANFSSHNGDIIDNGLVLLFQAPHSFTGEDVVELQGHGGPVIQDLLMAELVHLGARQARAGEFSERAFLNDKIDLTQAEAIADLIDSSTKQAALGAMRSLQGSFSEKVNQLLEQLIYLRMYVEAAIDFPEEEIDFLADEKVRSLIDELTSNLDLTISQADQGTILRNGLNIALAGKPNAGKSSLLNALSGHDAAIVTDVPGTTRDVITQTISIDGLAVHLIDTAGLRDSSDAVEKIGVQRALQQIEQADHVLHLIDIQDAEEANSLENELPHLKVTKVFNKIDLASQNDIDKHGEAIYISALTGKGIEQLKDEIKKLAGFKGDSESLFTARRRHLSALVSAQKSVQQGLEELKNNNAGELLADELLQAQKALNEITGQFNADDLLGEIFSGFCIGK